MLAKTKLAATVPLATRILAVDQEFPLFRGGSLSEVDIAYEHWGKLSAGNDNAILLFTGLSPSAHATSSLEDPSNGWWQYMVGPGRPIDTNRFFVVCINSLGSCFGSTGPASVNPDSGKLYRLEFPELSVEDIATAGLKVCQSLGIDKIHTAVGASLGGMSALALTIMHPNHVERLISISAAAHATPFAIAIRSLQREIIRNDPKWNEGNYKLSNPPTDGMHLARKLGLISYRSAEEYLERFGRKRILKSQPVTPQFTPEFAVENYLDYNAGNFINQFDTNCYLYLSRAIDWFDIAAHGGSLSSGFARIKTKSNLIVGVETDLLFPIWQQQEIVDHLKNKGLRTNFKALSCLQGHDSFLIDEEQFRPVVKQFFVEN